MVCGLTPGVEPSSQQLSRRVDLSSGMLSKEEMGQFCSPLNLLWAVYKFMFYNMEGIIYKRNIIQI